MGDVTKLPEAAFVAKSAIRAVVRSEIKRFVDDVLTEVLGRVISETRAEIEAGFRDAMAEFGFKGSWSADVLYRRGNFVATGGNLWCANHDSKDVRPGADGTWSMVCKSGRDGRDGRDAVPAEPTPRRPTAATTGRPT